MQNTNLRGMVTTIDAVLSQMTTVPAGAIPPSSLVERQVAWAALVGALALGPEPDVRLCPRCGHTAMAAASRCGFCWLKLVASTNGSPT